MSQHISHLSDNLSTCLDRAVSIGQESDTVTVPPTFTMAGPEIVVGASGGKGSVQCDIDKVMDDTDSGNIASDSASGDGSTTSYSGDDGADSDGSFVEEDTSCRKKTTCVRQRNPKKSGLCQDFSDTSSNCSSVEADVNTMENCKQGQAMPSVLPETVKCPQLSSRKLLKSNKTGVSRPSARTSFTRQGKDPEMMSSFFIGSLSAKKKALKVSSDALPTIVVYHSLLSFNRSLKTGLDREQEGSKC